MSVRLAVVVSHPIQHFAPWHREVAKLKQIDLKVFFCCDWGCEAYFDPDFVSQVKWDIPLLDGYDYDFLPIRQRPKRLTYWQVDNPAVSDALERFNPHVVKVFGYAHKTSWRVSRWTEEQRKPLLLYSDSNAHAQTARWKQMVKSGIVGRFYSRVDGALYVGSSNREYHRRYGLESNRLFPGQLPVDTSRLLTSIPDRVHTRHAVRAELGLPENAFVVMHCGKHTVNKNPIDLVSAAWKAKSKGIPVWSMLVGDGPQTHVIEEYCRSNNVTNCILTGFVNQSSIAKYYAASDSLIVTSKVDNHPLVVSEAATFGLPVIVNDHIGCIGRDDTARPGVNALVYAFGDVVQLSNLIEQLFRDRDLYLRMSHSASDIARSQDVKVAARSLAFAAETLVELGPR